MPTSRSIAALEPFGYYDPKVDTHLTGDATTGWKARFDVTPGDPAIVREEHVEVLGEGKDQRRVAAADRGLSRPRSASGSITPPTKRARR